MTAIIDYGMGNLGSIKNMLKKIGYASEITADPDLIRKAERLILPGVGAFDKAMTNLEDLQLIQLIKEKAIGGTPLLGICLGMQLLSEGSEEGVLPGLGLIPGRVKKFVLPAGYKVPHMGWNTVDYQRESLLYANFGIFEEARFYFVHSYHFVCSEEQDASGLTEYAQIFTSSVEKGGVYGVQFHPEKSHKFGMQMLRNFIELVPC